MDPERTITFDPAENQPMDRQFLLSQLVVPPPIAAYLLARTPWAEFIDNN